MKKKNKFKVGDSVGINIGNGRYLEFTVKSVREDLIEVEELPGIFHLQNDCELLKR